MNFASVIAGAVNGAVQAVIPNVAADVVRTIHKAQDASPMAPPVPPPAALDADAIAAKVIDRVMSNPAVAQVTTPLPWYQSQAIWGSLVAIATPIAGLIGYSLSAEDQGTLVAALVGIGSGVGGLLALYGRLTTSRQIKGA